MHSYPAGLNLAGSGQNQFNAFGLGRIVFDKKYAHFGLGIELGSMVVVPMPPYG